MVNIWLMQLKPQGGEEGWNRGYAETYCIKNDLAGLGWPIKTKVFSVQDAKYFLNDRWKGKRTKLPNDNYRIEDPKPAIQFIEEMKEGDLIWTYYTAESEYYLGQVTNSWKQKALQPQSENRFLKMDLIWVRGVRWKKIPRSLVPGIIGVNPKMGTLCKTSTLPIDVKYCSYIYKNPKPHRNRYSKLGKKTFNDRLRPLHSLEVEDLICGYLQHKGWRLIRSSAAKHSRLFEGTFISSGSGSTGYLQVKSKNAKIRPEEINSYKAILKDEKDTTIFIYYETDKDLMRDVKERITKNQRDRVIRITYNQIEDYMKKHHKEIGKDLIIRLNLMNR